MHKGQSNQNKVPQLGKSYIFQRRMVGGKGAVRGWSNENLPYAVIMLASHLGKVRVLQR